LGPTERDIHKQRGDNGLKIAAGSEMPKLVTAVKHISCRMRKCPETRSGRPNPKGGGYLGGVLKQRGKE